MLVSEMVGPTGSVVGVYINPTIVETARQRTLAAGWAHITFTAGDIREIALDDDFDAVVGRLILVHLREPAVVLRHLLPHLRAGGVAAFYDLDCSVDVMSNAQSQPMQQVSRWFSQAVTYGGMEMAMGMKFHQVFLDAGFQAPQILAEELMGAWASKGMT